ncbi:MAG: c-type cytochrome domain-containing protein, partial [Planctomycetota bacterium]
MFPLRMRFVFFILLFSILRAPSLASELTDEESDFFENRIRPVLVEHCYACHNSAETAEAGIELDSRDGLLEADLIAPGNPDESYLMSVMRHEVTDMEMPKDGPKLDDRVLDDFSQWIRMGAPDPRDAPPTPSELKKATSWEATLDRRKAWWSMQPI